MPIICKNVVGLYLDNKRIAGVTELDAVSTRVVLDDKTFSEKGEMSVFAPGFGGLFGFFSFTNGVHEGTVHLAEWRNL